MMYRQTSSTPSNYQHMERMSFSEWWSQKKIDFLGETGLWNWIYLRPFGGILRKFWFFLQFPFSLSFFVFCYVPVSYLNNFPLRDSVLFKTIPKEAIFSQKILLWVVALPQIFIYFSLCIALWTFSVMVPVYIYGVLWFQLTEFFHFL